MTLRLQKSVSCFQKICGSNLVGRFGLTQFRRNMPLKRPNFEFGASLLQTRQFRTNQYLLDDWNISDVPKPDFNRAQVSFYKPNTSPEKGCAIQFKYSKQLKCIFVESAAQSGPKLPVGASGSQFDWEKKIVVKISPFEMGKFLSVLEGKDNEIDIFHSIERGGFKSQSSIKFQKQTGKYDSYLIKITKKNDNDPSSQVYMFIENAEGILLAQFLKNSLTFAFGFM